MPNTPQMLEVDDAYALVHQQVYAPVFFKKLAADYNIRPRNEQEAMKMLTGAAQLREAHEQNQQKTAASQGNLLDQAMDHLQGALTAQGYDVGGVPDQQITKLASELAQDPQLAHAMLTLQASASGITPDSLVGAGN